MSPNTGAPLRASRRFRLSHRHPGKPGVAQGQDEVGVFTPSSTLYFKLR